MYRFLNIDFGEPIYIFELVKYVLNNINEFIMLTDHCTGMNNDNVHGHSTRDESAID